MILPCRSQYCKKRLRNPQRMKLECTMIKVVGLMKKRPGMTAEEFRDYYETRHRPIGEKHLKPHVTRYVRRYLKPFRDPITGFEAEPEFDAVTEMWYRDQAAYDAVNARFAIPAIAAEVAADSEQLFDQSANRYFFVEEFESDVS
jgi:EthD domain